MWSYISLGLSMGLSAGLSPGPLLTLVVTASLRKGFAGGIRVALAPLISDAPIIALSVFLVGRLPADALRWVGTIGGLVVIWLGVETVRSAKTAGLPDGSRLEGDSQRDLLRGVLVNLLNPHPYLFWATVGGPALVSGWRQSPGHALSFLGSFYVLLIGSKIVMAWVVSRQSGKLTMTWYRRVLAGCGIVMVTMGGWLIWQAWTGS